MDTDLKRFEAELERLSPGSLPEGLIARMEAAMEGWEEVSEDHAAMIVTKFDKVVPFPGREDRENGSRSRSSLWAAAAGVALLGALSGVFFTPSPGPAKKSDLAGALRTPTIRSENMRPVDFAPQAAKRKILGASEGDVMIGRSGQPHRVVRFDYVDRVVFRNADGEEVHVEVPTVKYRLIPLVTD